MKLLKVFYMHVLNEEKTIYLFFFFFNSGMRTKNLVIQIKQNLKHTHLNKIKTRCQKLQLKLKQCIFNSKLKNWPNNGNNYVSIETKNNFMQNTQVIGRKKILFQ